MTRQKPTLIQSRDNPLLKDLRRLALDSTAYRKQGRVWLEGDHLCGAALVRGQRIEIRGFGSFSLHYRAPRVGRNPKTGQSVSLEGKFVPHFKPGKALREAEILVEDLKRYAAGNGLPAIETSSSTAELS